MSEWMVIFVGQRRGADPDIPNLKIMIPVNYQKPPPYIPYHCLFRHDARKFLKSPPPIYRNYYRKGCFKQHQAFGPSAVAETPAGGSLPNPLTAG